MNALRVLNSFLQRCSSTCCILYPGSTEFVYYPVRRTFLHALTSIDRSIVYIVQSHRSTAHSHASNIPWELVTQHGALHYACRMRSSPSLCTSCTYSTIDRWRVRTSEHCGLPTFSSSPFLTFDHGARSGRCWALSATWPKAAAPSSAACARAHGTTQSQRSGTAAC